MLCLYRIRQRYSGFSGLVVSFSTEQKKVGHIQRKICFPKNNVLQTGYWCWICLSILLLFFLHKCKDTNNHNKTLQNILTKWVDAKQGSSTGVASGIVTKWNHSVHKRASSGARCDLWGPLQRIAAWIEGGYHEFSKQHPYVRCKFFGVNLQVGAWDVRSYTLGLHRAECLFH